MGAGCRKSRYDEYRKLYRNIEFELRGGVVQMRLHTDGGALQWGGRDFELRPASWWKERYALVDGDRELAVLDGKGWGKRPVRITVERQDLVEPGLLLFAAFVVRGLAEDASAATSGAATA